MLISCSLSKDCAHPSLYLLLGFKPLLTLQAIGNKITAESTFLACPESLICLINVSLPAQQKFTHERAQRRNKELKPEPQGILSYYPRVIVVFKKPQRKFKYRRQSKNLLKVLINCWHNFICCFLGVQVFVPCRFLSQYSRLLSF